MAFATISNSIKNNLIKFNYIFSIGNRRIYTTVYILDAEFAFCNIEREGH